MAKIIKNSFHNFLLFCFIFLIVTGWIFSGWPQIWQNPPFPPKVQKAYAADTVIFTETCASNPTQPLNTSTTITVGTSWSARIALYGTPATTINSGTANCSPLADTTNIGFGYTMTPAPTTNQYYVDYVWIDGGTISAASGNGVLLNYIDTNNYYACMLKDDATPDAYIYKVSGGVGSTLTSNVDRTVANNAQIECRIDYSGTNPVITMTNITTATQLATVTDSSSPLTKTGKAGVYCGAIPAATGDDCESSLDFDTARLSTVPNPTAPTVTTQAGSSVEATTATGNGNITDTGGQNATAWGVCYKTSTGCTTADSVAAGSGTGGTGAFTASMTSLSSGTTYYIKAYATNSAGTSYGSEVTILTKPAAPTGVAATDGTYTDKVTITWTKSTGATNYNVWRDSTDLGAAGDVATFDDTGAAAPTITPGSAVASDGTSTVQVDLSLSGASANNGTTYTYKVVASNATGNSVDSATDTGYRGVGSLTYQWQRSAADSDASYSDISGATTANYNDTGAPADGSGRYYKVVENATGATQQISTADRGYRMVIVYSVSVDPTSVNYGGMTINSTKASATITATVGDAATKLNIKGTNATYTEVGKCGDGVCTWVLSTALGEDQYVHGFTKDTALASGGSLGSDPATQWVALTTTNQLLAASVTANGSQTFKLDMRTPSSAGTETNLGSQYSTDVIIVASAP